MPLLRQRSSSSADMLNGAGSTTRPRTQMPARRPCTASRALGASPCARSARPLLRWLRAVAAPPPRARCSPRAFRRHCGRPWATGSWRSSCVQIRSSGGTSPWSVPWPAARSEAHQWGRHTRRSTRRPVAAQQHTRSRAPHGWEPATVRAIALRRNPCPQCRAWCPRATHPRPRRRHGPFSCGSLLSAGRRCATDQRRPPSQH
mmetsp:Transcript_48621/g.128239  ORF Transcript_48621/g.128239 Transcript_48621/m.128239 type:complete len:203 (+) Transcript_48621:269-877(+)